jgi:glucose/arabinose dehydrogenase
MYSTSRRFAPSLRTLPAVAGGSSFPLVESLEPRALLTALPAGFSQSIVAGNLGSPSAMDVLPDGRVLVTSQTGQLRVIKNGKLLRTPFLNISVDDAGERGLLGVTHDPNFATNHFIYLYHTVPAANGAAAFNEVSRFTAAGDVAVPGSEVDILQLSDLSSVQFHNGGAIHFGLDGMLYVDAGENTNPANAQTLSNLLGKTLRIDVSNIQPGDPVNDVAKLIPPDNPFTPGHAMVAAGINQAIYALGLRNPFTFAVQPITGEIFVNDVGLSTWEEIDKLVPGGNYGWIDSEGFKQPGDPSTTIGVYQDPQMAYNHVGGPSGGGSAIVGGTFYEPPAGATHPFPASFDGKYFFEDLSKDFIRLFDPANPGTVANPDTSSGFATGTANNPVDITMAPDGSLYYLARGNGGQLLKITFASKSRPQILTQPASTAAATGSPVTFSVVADGPGTLRYHWQRENRGSDTFVNIRGATSPSFTLSSAGSQDNHARFRVVVTNANGAVISRAAKLTVGPIPESPVS